MAKQTHPLAGGIGILAALALLFSASAGAELRLLGDGDLDDVVGQAGISISASLNLQENPSQTRCAGGCGARLAIQPAGSGNNYLVIDDISGKFSFDEVTLDVVTIKDGFGGDGAAVLALMPNPEAVELDGRAHYAILVPTAPIPVGGGLLYVPVEWVKPAQIGMDTFTSIYVSMGITPPPPLAAAKVLAEPRAEQPPAAP